MGNRIRIQKSDLMVIGVLMTLVGLVLLIKIDFTWGILCLFGAGTCFSQVSAVGGNDPAAED